MKYKTGKAKKIAQYTILLAKIFKPNNSVLFFSTCVYTLFGVFMKLNKIF
jgi:hypothetical protein